MGIVSGETTKNLQLAILHSLIKTKTKFSFNKQPEDRINKS
jgi:hypothetical protein